MEDLGRRRSRAKVVSGVVGAGAMLFGGTLLALGGLAGADSQTSSNIAVNCVGGVALSTTVPSVTVADTPDTAPAGGTVAVSIAAQLPSVPLEGTMLQGGTVTFPIPAQITGLSNVTFTGGNLTGSYAVNGAAVTFSFTGPVNASTAQLPTINFVGAVAAGTVGQTINWTVFSSVGLSLAINTNGTQAILNDTCTPVNAAQVLNTTPIVAPTTTTTTTTTAPTTTTSTTAPTTTTSTTAPTTTTSTTAPTTTTTTAPTTTTTAGPTTTTTTAGPTTTTTAGPTTTTTTRPTTTTTAGPTTTTKAAATPTVVVSPTTLHVGDSFTVQTSGWKPGSTVTVVFRSDPVVLGTLIADATGSASGTYTVPGVELGAHVVAVSGTTTDALIKEATATVTVVAATEVQGVNESNPTTSGSLPTTGAGSTTTTGIAVLLMGAGIGLVFASRRRPQDD